VLGSITAAAIALSHIGLPILARTGATFLVILATLTAVEIVTTRRVQDELTDTSPTTAPPTPSV